MIIIYSRQFKISKTKTHQDCKYKYFYPANQNYNFQDFDIYQSFSMITENTILIENVIELSTAYLTRFFQKAGLIKTFFKDYSKKSVVIEFKTHHAFQRAFQFHGRVLDKMPMSIKNYTQKKQLTKNQRQKSVPKYEQKQTKFMLKKQSSTTKLFDDHFLINYSDTLFNIDLQSVRESLLQQIGNKSMLWKFILNQIMKGYPLTIDKKSYQDIVLTTAFSLWTLIQIKLKQIQHLIMQRQNSKSKYIQVYLQQMITSKLLSLKNQNLIQNSYRNKSIINQKWIEFNLQVKYPEQTEEQASFMCNSTSKVKEFLSSLQSVSKSLALIYHYLQTNSLIIYHDQQSLQKLIIQFTTIRHRIQYKSDDRDTIINNKYQDKIISNEYQDKIISNENENIKISNKILDKIQSVGLKVEIQQIIQKDKVQQRKYINKINQIQFNIKSQYPQNNFSGFIQNIGTAIFNDLLHFKYINPIQNNIGENDSISKSTHNSINCIIWIQTKYNINYPNYLYCNLLLDGCRNKIIAQKQFYNLYQLQKLIPNQQTIINQPLMPNQLITSKYELIQKQQKILENKVIIFEECQFGIIEALQYTLRLIQYFQMISQSSVTINQPSVIINQRSINQKQINPCNSKLKQPVQMVYVFSNSHIKKEFIIKSIKQFIRTFGNKWASLNIRLSFIQIILQRQHQFNAFKCQLFLIDYIDNQIIKKNSIIASQEVAHRLAQKILKQASIQYLADFNDKKYVGSQLWRLYQKSGQRRAKKKISQYALSKRIKQT